MAFWRKYLGHGVGLRAKHFGAFLSAPPPVDWLEAISENFMAPGGRPIAVLEKVRREVPVVLHGVSLSIGSVDPLSERYLHDLTALVRRIEPAWISDHLCWGTHGGRYVHDLLPLPYTEEALAHVAVRVERVQERLGRQILLENVSSYVAFKDSTMTEWQFLSEVSRRADCGILLDINNVYVSARNHGFDPWEYLAGIPADRVGQFHLAGHSNKGRYLLDTHDHPIPDSVWDLYREALRRFGAVSTLVEWDDAIPPLELLVDESRRAAAIEAETVAAVLKRKALP
ncbi:MAG TPA: DUF692 domain-containing protein [Myxococcaceae bacterium]|nr:DUF692 domain-containing protein [Myxococcaceae bacterium]